jgi:alpha-L-fucosidase 2
MLLQSQDGFINPVPALPSEWKSGQLKGFKVRSGAGATVDLEWENGKIKTLTVTGGAEQGVRILNPATGKIIECDVRPGKKRTYRF